MKIKPFKHQHDGFGGRFLNTTTNPTAPIIIPTHPNGGYPRVPLYFGSSEQVYHFLKVVDYVNARLGQLHPVEQNALIYYVDELAIQMTAYNHEVFLPRQHWDPLLSQFINGITQSCSQLSQELLLAIPPNSNDYTTAWNICAGAAYQKPYNKQNYERMVRTLMYKLAADSHFRGDMEKCLKDGIFPVEYSNHDSTWATGKDGSGLNLLGAAMLEAAVQYFGASRPIHKDFCSLKQGTNNFIDLFNKIKAIHPSSMWSHDELHKIATLDSLEVTAPLPLQHEVLAGFSSFAPFDDRRYYGDVGFPGVKEILCNEKKTKLVVEDISNEKHYLFKDAKTGKWRSGGNPSTYGHVTNTLNAKELDTVVGLERSDLWNFLAQEPKFTTKKATQVFANSDKSKIKIIDTVNNKIHYLYQRNGKWSNSRDPNRYKSLGKIELAALVDFTKTDPSLVKLLADNKISLPTEANSKKHNTRRP